MYQCVCILYFLQWGTNSWMIWEHMSMHENTFLIIPEIFHINFVTLGKFRIGVSYQPSFFTVLFGFGCLCKRKWYDIKCFYGYAWGSSLTFSIPYPYFTFLEIISSFMNYYFFSTTFWHSKAGLKQLFFCRRWKAKL